MRTTLKAFLTIALGLILHASLSAQTTSGSISGIVKDAQGATVPNAKVSITSTSRGDTVTTDTDSEGHFVFPQLQPGTYSLRIEGSGFKTFEKSGVVLNANDKISAGEITLEIGAVAESVTVTARGAELQTESAERGNALVGTVLDNIAVNSRSYLALVGLAPGVVSTANLQVAGHGGLGAISANGARSNQNNLTLDGIGNVDTGNNGDQLATLSLDAVAEYKILTANYQAEYGRSSGAQISVVSRGGGSDFHGSGFLYHRHEGLNANNWRNNRDGTSRNLYRFNDYGYTIGGPIFYPGKFNRERDKLFFFWSQEFQRQLRPQGERRVTMPTELERRGDFSQSVDRDNNPFPFIRDSTTGKPCSRTDTSGCFADGGVLGRIPANRLYGPGLAILKIFPLPNAISPGNRGFNFISQISDSYPRREDLIRIDWNPSESWRVFGRYVNNFDSVTSNYGSFVLGANFPLVRITDARPGRALALSATKIINPTTVNEVTWGFGHNQINIDPVNDGLTRTKTNLKDLPVLFSSAIQKDFIPQFAFGGRISNGPNFGTNNAPFFNYNTTFDFVDNFSKVFNQHSIKTGVYFQRSKKDQTSFANANGNISFSDSSSNPFDTGFAFANAATGVYNTFNQASLYATGQYRYNNIEFYVQDNWKVTQRLTLDYGMRFYWIEPQYDKLLQTSSFLIDRFDAKKAVRLFRPAFDSKGVKIGIDPATGLTTDALNIGKIVPNSGDLLNGIVQAGKGIERGLMENRGIHYGPRFGFAYDIMGHRNLVVRGGAGVFYDRFQGNETFDMLTNPPTTVSPTLQNGLLKDIDPDKVLLAPSNLHAFSHDGKVPTVYNFNLGVQVKLPAAFMMDVSYVGSQSRHLLQRFNINAIPYGATFRPENQDPTKVKANPNAVLGSNALDADFLRPFPGFGNITLHQMGASTNYNSLQTTLDRRFLNGLLLGVSYTWSRALGSSAGGDGNFFRIDQFNRLSNYGLLSVHRKHNLVVNYVYELPKISRWMGGHSIARTALDNWQISGVYRYQSGAPYGLGFSIPAIGNAQLTGSYTEGARVRIVGDPGIGNGSETYRQFNTAAVTIPQPGSLGLESGRDFLIGPGINNFDFSLQKSFPLGESRRLELRADAFNVFNHTQFSGVNSTLNVRSLTDPTPTNLPFDAKGNLVNRNGFGTVGGARDPRIMQLVVRVKF